MINLTHQGADAYMIEVVDDDAEIMQQLAVTESELKELNLKIENLLNVRLNEQYGFMKGK